MQLNHHPRGRTTNKKPILLPQLKGFKLTSMRASSLQRLIFLRGILFLLVFGPICLFAGLLAALALFEQFIAGWTPSNWFNWGGPLDQLAGGGPGAFSGYVRFMICAVIASASAGVIVWSFDK